MRTAAGTQVTTRRGWARIGLIYLAVIDLPVGLWAVFAPENFYRNFPGGGRHWVSTQGPFNHHLVTDAGAGFLAVAAALLLAALWMSKPAIIVALVASLAHDLPHFIFHLTHTNHALAAGDQVVSTGGLGIGCVVAAVLLTWVRSWAS
jgi:hypothetical protein